VKNEQNAKSLAATSCCTGGEQSGSASFGDVKLTCSLDDTLPANHGVELVTGILFTDQAIAANSSRLWRLIVLILSLLASSHAPAQEASAARSSSARAVPSPFAEAETLLRQGSTEEAKQKIQEQLALHPTSVAGYNLLGIAYSSEKDYAGAFDAFQHALKLSPNSTKTHNNLGNLYVAQNKPDLAEKEFRTALRSNPADSEGNYNLGLLLIAKGSPAEAIPYFQRVRPANMETRFNLVRCYLQSGQTAAGLTLARTLSAQNKDDVRLHFTLGVFLASAKQYREAQMELEKANALQPETFEILYNLGQAYLRGRDYAKAELALNRALKLKPDSPETLYLLAQVDADQSKAVDALDLLARAHKLAPENTDIIFLLARVSMSQNYFEDAIPLLESGLKIAPQRADLQAALGESYFMAGRADRAIEEFKKLIALDPNARSYAFMGLCFRRLGRFDEARKYFQEGLKLDRRNATCLFNIGYIEERQGNEAAAEKLFQETLRSNPDFPEALLELANLRISQKKFSDAAELLRRYVKSSRNPSTGYYKLAMVERNLHQTEAAQRDLSVFQTLSKDAPTGPYPYQHLFDYLNNRSELAPVARTQLDLTELTEQIQKHPDQPQDLYLLAEAYLKLGKVDEARKAITQLDQLSAGDYRTQTGVGVLLARFRLYDDAIPHFQSASRANPDADDVKFDLADAYFRKGLYSQALETARSVSTSGQQDDALLSLVGDIYAHLGDSARAEEIFRNAIARNPDNDQYYLSLALVELRQGDSGGAEETLQKGLSRIPSSGKILWGLGIVSVLQGKTDQAAQRFERAVELLPEWAGSYSTLGVFYYETGQIDKAREVLNRFKGSNAGGLDVNRIEETLSKAPATAASAGEPLPMAARQQLLQLALSLADRTL
jgi:tetratricopeptide (TPR) repeat protein